MSHEEIDDFMEEYESNRIRQEECYFRVTDDNLKLERQKELYSKDEKVRLTRQRVIGKVRDVMGEIPEAMLNDIDDEIRNLYEEHGCANVEEAVIAVLPERLPMTPEIATELLFENPTVDRRGEITVGQYVLGYF